MKLAQTLVAAFPNVLRHPRPQHLPQIRPLHKRHHPQIRRIRSRPQLHRERLPRSSSPSPACPPSPGSFTTATLVSFLPLFSPASTSVCVLSSATATKTSPPCFSVVASTATRPLSAPSPALPLQSSPAASAPLPPSQTLPNLRFRARDLHLFGAVQNHLRRIHIAQSPESARTRAAAPSADADEYGSFHPS